MPRNEGVPMATTGALVAIGGSAGAILASSTLERAVIGLVVGMTVGLGANAIWRALRGRPLIRSAAPTAHPV